MAATERVLGVDGGGTKTVAWLAPLAAADQPLGAGLAGPGNPRAAGFPAALANIQQAIEAAFHAAGEPQQPVVAACLALAGADRAEERVRIEGWAVERQLAARVRVTNDAEPLLAAASPTGWGIALIAGTGSFSIGRDAGGRTERCGGWGYLLGDEGGAYAIAVSGLRAAVRAADGRAPSTELLKRFLVRLGVGTAAELVPALYRTDITRHQIADLADVVLQASQAGDVAAGQIVRDAAGELALLVRTLRARLGLAAGGYPLALAGGVLIHAAEIRGQLEQLLAATGDAPQTVTLVPEPVRGAVELARRMAAP